MDSPLQPAWRLSVGIYPGALAIANSAYRPRTRVLSFAGLIDNFGECRLTVAIRRLLSDTALLQLNAIAPPVEHIVVLRAGNTLPTSLTGEKRSGQTTE